MTKKQTAPEAAVDTPIEAAPLANTAVPAPDVDWARQSALQFALDHHRINGGMLTVDQVLANAVKFHTFIKGEQA